LHVKSRLDELYAGSARADLGRRLAAYIEPRRWFRSKTRAVSGTVLEQVIPLPIGGTETAIGIVRVQYTRGPEDEYVVPLTWVHGDAGAHLAQTRPHLVVGAVAVDGEERPRWLVDALGERHALEELLALVARGVTVDTDDCSLTFRSIGPAVVTAGISPRPVETEQSNTSIVYGDAYIMKIVRKLDDGPSPDLEMSEFLTNAGFANTPRLLAAIELARPSREPTTVGVVHAFVRNDGDAWTFALREVAQLAAASTRSNASALESSIAFVRPLARRVAQMHSALAAPTSDPRFAPERIERVERQALGLAVERAIDDAWALVDERAGQLTPDSIAHLRSIRSRAAVLRDAVTRFVDSPSPFIKTRVHGDLHLGQVLVCGEDFVLIDFEGEPARPLADRKAKRSPLADVAGMLRSLHYASLAEAGPSAPADRQATASAKAWHDAARREFLRAYYEAFPARSVLAEGPAAEEALLRFYLLEKCIYELHYELNNRPAWSFIPVCGLESLLEDADAT
jgi:trehalose synthase-fused probable maltokinase